MRILLLVLLSLCLLPSTDPAHADSIPQAIAALRECHATDVPQERLECYDEKVGAILESLDTPETCALESWTFTQDQGVIQLSGTTSCRYGLLTYRLYDGETGAFVGADKAFIRGFAFQDALPGTAPKKLDMRYTIEE